MVLADYIAVALIMCSKHAGDVDLLSYDGDGFQVLNDKGQCNKVLILLQCH